jgi:hypothetical protein
MQVAVLKDASDLGSAVAELTRLRARGCRGFSVLANPANGFSIGHPTWDRLWSAATDLGMIYVMHIGFTRRASTHHRRVHYARCVNPTRAPFTWARRPGETLGLHLRPRTVGVGEAGCPR